MKVVTQEGQLKNATSSYLVTQDGTLHQVKEAWAILNCGSTPKKVFPDVKFIKDIPNDIAIKENIQYSKQIWNHWDVKDPTSHDWKIEKGPSWLTIKDGILGGNSGPNDLNNKGIETVITCDGIPSNVFKMCVPTWSSEFQFVVHQAAGQPTITIAEIRVFDENGNRIPNSDISRWYESSNHQGHNFGYAIDDNMGTFWQVWDRNPPTHWFKIIFKRRVLISRIEFWPENGFPMRAPGHCDIDLGYNGYHRIGAFDLPQPPNGGYQYMNLFQP